jgi:hypothetical protein
MVVGIVLLTPDPNILDTSVLRKIRIILSRPRLLRQCGVGWLRAVKHLFHVRYQINYETARLHV